MARKRSSITIRMVDSQVLRQVMDGMRDRFAASIHRAVEREMRQMFGPVRKSKQKTRSRRKASTTTGRAKR